jgi:hypothetical protein
MAPKGLKIRQRESMLGTLRAPVEETAESVDRGAVSHFTRNDEHIVHDNLGAESAHNSATHAFCGKPMEACRGGDWKDRLLRLGPLGEEALGASYSPGAPAS